MPTIGAQPLEIAPQTAEQSRKRHRQVRPMLGVLAQLPLLHTFDSGLEKRELPDFDRVNWYPALLAARKEYLRDRMAEITELPPAEALAAMNEFNEADLALLGLKRVEIKQ